MTDANITIYSGTNSAPSDLQTRDQLRIYGLYVPETERPDALLALDRVTLKLFSRKRVAENAFNSQVLLQSLWIAHHGGDRVPTAEDLLRYLDQLRAGTNLQDIIGS